MALKKVDGKWRTDFRAANGKRIRESFDTREEARDFQTRMQHGVTFDTPEEGKLIVVAISEYLETETVKKESESDEKAFLVEFNNWLNFDQKLEYLGKVELIHLNKYQNFLKDGAARTKLEMTKWEAIKKKAEADLKEGIRTTPFSLPKPTKEKRGLSASSVNRHFHSITAFFDQAKKWKWIDSNPCAELEPLPEQPVKRKPWPSNESVQNAIDLAAMWAKAPYYLIARTGMRPVECKKMELDDIEFHNRQFKAKSLKGDGTLRERWIPMTDDLFDFFKWLVSERKKMPVVGKHSNLVFLSPTLQPLDTKALAREMARITKKLGLEGYTLYGFRHKFVTDMANPSLDRSRSGNLQAAQMLVGHASINQTRHYDHSGERVVREAFEILSEERRIVFKKEG